MLPRRAVGEGGGAWLITGTASGLGRAVAARLEARGTPVLRLDRNDPGGDDPARRLQLDLATDEGLAAARQALVDHRPAVLLSCAGVAQTTPLLDTPAALDHDVMTSMFTAPHTLMLAMARLAGDDGRPAWVVNVLSPFRAVGIRNQGIYSAAKAALSRTGEALAVELPAEHPLRLVGVMPGAFNSNLRPVAANDSPAVKAYRRFVARTPDDVARDLLRRLDHRSSKRYRSVRLGLDAPVLEVAGDVAPSDLWRALLDKVAGQRPLDGSGH